ncbi:putative membrane protein [Sinorhizobium fredii]
MKPKHPISVERRRDLLQRDLRNAKRDLHEASRRAPWAEWLIKRQAQAAADDLRSAQLDVAWLQHALQEE